MRNGSLYKVKEFFGFVEDVDMSESTAVTQDKQPLIKPFKSTVVSAPVSRQFTLSEIKVEEPRIYEDSLQVATHLREGKPVVINLKYLDKPTGKRLIDFICGTAYAINGHMLKIAEHIFLCTPENVLIAQKPDKHPVTPVIEQESEQDQFFKRVASY